MNENETNAAPIVPPTSSICPTPRASGCSKSESDTPRTDTFYDDHLDFGYYESDEWHKFASQLERELAVARKGLEAVASLMDESHGVDGLHLNGDLAPWDELRTGGRFEEWLVAFDDALNAARSSNTSVLLPPLGGGKEQRVVGRPSDLSET